MSEFDVIASDLFKEIQDFIDKDDYENNQKLKELCEKFDNFYHIFYEQTTKVKNGLKRNGEYLLQLKNFINNDRNFFSIMAHHLGTSILTSYLEATRQLETFLVMFKTIFLKTLNEDYIQYIVIEAEDNSPIVIQLTSPSSMAYFIKQMTSNFEGKLVSNETMLARYRNNKHFNNIAKAVEENTMPYMDIYVEARRRINVFYKKVNTTNGRALLLYRYPSNQWYKFFILNLGDFKQGYVGMILNRPVLDTDMEKNIYIFTKYIKEVDSIQGTLIQDIQIINELDNNIQGAVKSGLSETGSHEGIIKLIREVASGNFEKIKEFFNKDQTKSAKAAPRDKLLNDTEAINKTANIMNNASRFKAEDALNAVIKELDKRS